MEQSYLEEVAHRAWWSLVIRGLLAIAVGVLILVRPMESVAAFALVVALWALMQGVVAMVHAFDIRPFAPHWWMLLLSGIIGTLFGLAALYYYPALSLAFVVVWAVWWLAIGGITAIGAALYERRSGLSWGWTMAWGLIAILTAVIAFGNPPGTLATLMSLIAVFAVVGGIVLLTAAVRVRNAPQRVAHAVRSDYSHAPSH